MNKEEYIKKVSSTCFWVQWPSDKIKDFTEYVNEHPELKIRDFIEIAAKGNSLEFLGVVIDKFGASAFAPEDGNALILFKGYQSPVVADIVIERGLALDVLKAYRDRLADEVCYTYNLDKGNLTIAYAKISDAITNKQKENIMNNTIETINKKKIYTNRDGFKNYTLDTVLDYVSETENIRNWLEKPFIPDWVKKGARFKCSYDHLVYEIVDVQYWREIVLCHDGSEFRFIEFIAPIGKVPNCVPVEEEDDSKFPKWADAGHWVFDKVKKQIRYVDSISLSLSNRGNVALGFYDGRGWVGTIEELKKQFSPSDVKIDN